MNYGFINLNNDANEFPLVVRLKKDDPLLEAKRLMLKEELKTFRVMIDFNEAVMPKFLSFLRFVEFDGNLNVFHLMQDQWTKKGADSDDEEGAELVFRADKISPQSLALERKVFAAIK